MLKKRNHTLHRLEIALLLGVALSLLIGTWLSGEQTALSSQIVRLHVIGASDSEADQAAKLLARDAVLDLAGPWLEGVTDQTEAMAVLAAHLPELAQAGARAAGTTAMASVEDSAWFPTKEYEDFSLPAGRYPALKITLGEGEGRNWWCVVFPPLCMGSVTEAAQEAGSFSEDQINLITGENEGYIVKFKALELWNEFSQWASRDR